MASAWYNEWRQNKKTPEYGSNMVESKRHEISFTEYKSLPHDMNILYHSDSGGHIGMDTDYKVLQSVR